ncbi:hypothetical protein WL88_14225 [Burkholderia diffusa]|uniref:Uncharacterized protein n=1 Tax=Burkholderia diffusa TaxID=488732 RepID=A0AAW3PHI3_9BURK|nr:hypothetical protein [Burkholderia diffusa]KWF35814.1 hypothetical protein WL85_15785 [Burkholderia diffusa]KWF44618.1 hypothetical protein WL86_08290 [Burkholderia diffusa]KWF47028.1 hypothetical protein WL87_21145 [Burkholderia diffusa]KWF54530.1 hypothetical protein WL88_14225 [Burkholderia diffusa]KWF86187.1 hypothetical protein WL93_18100 [Burkholderia diffusa]
MKKFEIKYPSWYDELAEFEHEEKGFLQDVLITSEGAGDVQLNFYDMTRFAQDAADSVRTNGFFYMTGVVIVESVSRTHIEAAAQRIVEDGLAPRV